MSSGAGANGIASATSKSSEPPLGIWACGCLGCFWRRKPADVCSSLGAEAAFSPDPLPEWMS